MICVYPVNNTQWSTHFPEVVLGKEAEILYFLHAARSYATDLCPYIGVKDVDKMWLLC